MPALLTSTSTGPWCSSTSVNARSTAAASVTSHSTPNKPSGAPLPRWVTATASPWAAKERAIASPIPRFPPVTSTDLLTNPPLRPATPSLGNLVGGVRSHLPAVGRPSDRRERAGPSGARGTRDGPATPGSAARTAPEALAGPADRQITSHNLAGHPW